MDEPTGLRSQTRKPQISYLLATVFGIGYLRPAPGTWGSLVGVAISVLISYGISASHAAHHGGPSIEWLVVIVISAVGVLASNRVVRHSGIKDPQFVVIDEVAGQLVALSLPFVVLNWKSWLLGFLLFRLFDIWKPFPARQAESLPGGWGIMADDWIAGIYAALVLVVAHRIGL